MFLTDVKVLGSAKEGVKTYLVEEVGKLPASVPNIPSSLALIPIVFPQSFPFSEIGVPLILK